MLIRFSFGISEAIPSGISVPLCFAHSVITFILSPEEGRRLGGAGRVLPPKQRDVRIESWTWPKPASNDL